MWPRIAQLLVLLALGGVIALAASWAAAADTGGAFGWPLPDWMPPPPVPADNPMSAAKVELGRYLVLRCPPGRAELHVLLHLPSSGARLYRRAAGGDRRHRRAPSPKQPVARQCRLPARAHLGRSGRHQPGRAVEAAAVRRAPGRDAAAGREAGDRRPARGRSALRAPVRGGVPRDRRAASISSRSAGPWRRSSGRCSRSTRPTTGAATRGESRRDQRRRRSAARAVLQRSAGLRPVPSARRFFTDAVGPTGTTIPASTISTARVPCRPATKASSSTRESRRTWAGSARRACAMSP